MSALVNNNNNSNTNYGDGVREESKSVSVAEVELGLLQGGARYSNESQLADPEEAIVATQLEMKVVDRRPVRSDL